MARRAFIEVVGDARSYLASLKRSSEATHRFEADLKGLATNARTTAEAQVQASIKRDARLRQDVAAYKAVAAQAKAGSREQITASNLAAEAQRKLARSTSLSAREQQHLSTEARQAAASLRVAEAQTGRLTRGMVGAGGALKGMLRNLALVGAGFLGFTYGTELIKSSIEAATNLHEQLNKVKVVLGTEATHAVEAWADKAATGFGLAKDEALEFIGTFGALLRPLGVAQDQAGSISKTLTGLGADLASFYNTEVTDALQAIQSGLLGQARPLRRYGVALSEARVKAEAFATGLAKPTVSLEKVKIANTNVALAQGAYNTALAKHGKGSREAMSAQNALARANLALKAALAGNKTELTDAQKVMARYQLIMKDTALAQGDFARTSGGLANQQRILHAQVRNLEEGVGQLLLPSVLSVVKAMNKWLKEDENQRRVLDTLRGVVHAVVGGVKALRDVAREIVPPIKDVVDAFGGLKVVLEAIIALKIASKLTALSGGLTGVGSAAGGATGKVGGLAGALGAIPRSIGVTIGVTAFFKGVGDKGVQGLFERAGGAGLAAFMLTGNPYIAAGAAATAAVGPYVAPYVKDPGKLLPAHREGGGPGLTGTGPNSRVPNNVVYGGEGVGWIQVDVNGKNMGTLPNQKDAWSVFYSYGNRGRPIPGQGVRENAAKAAGTRSFYTPPAGGGETYKPPPGPKPPPPPGGGDGTEKWRQAFDKVMQRYQLALSRAQLTKGSKDDLQVLAQMQHAIEGQLKIHKGDLQLQQQLVDVQGQRLKLEQDIAKEAAEAAKKRREQIASAKEDLRSQVPLFGGPVLAPGEDAVKRALGVRIAGADVGALTSDLRGQLAAFNAWQADLLKLQQRGAPAQLLSELRAGGLATAPQVHALATSGASTFQEYVAVFRKLEAALGTAAKHEVQQMNVTAQRVVISRGAAATRAHDAATTAAGAPVVVKVEVDGKELAGAVTVKQQRRNKSWVQRRRGIGGSGIFG